MTKLRMTLLGVVLGAAALGACTKPRGTACPGNAPDHCVADQVCTFDETQGCHVCTCEPLDNQPGTPNPDDRSQPPPMHDANGR